MAKNENITHLFTYSLINLFTSKKKAAFTLAEVLITLAIIGVVAAITIPGLINSYQDKIIVNKLPEVYSILQQAYKMSIEDNGPVSSWNLSSDATTARGEIMDKFLPYMKSYHICNSGNTNNKCTYYKVVDLAGEDTNSASQYNIVLGNTTKVNIDDNTNQSTYVSRADCSKYGGCNFGSLGSKGEMNIVHTIMVNVTGKENKPMWGRDLFLFAIMDDGILPYGEVGWHKTSNCDPSGHGSAGWWNGSTCAGYVLKHKNVNYLKCTRGQQKYCTGNYQP